MKTLILYATTHGSTAVCAEKLAKILGGQTDVSGLKHFSGFDAAQYDCVIVGSSIYGGSVVKEAKDFCRTNCNALLKKPFAIFFSCLSENEKDIQNYLNQNFPPELAKHALACSSLGGAFYFTKLNFLERLIDKGLAKAYAKFTGIPAPDGKTDFVTISDEKIAAFAEKIKHATGVSNDS